MPDLSPGDPVRIEMTKWVDRPHWIFEGLWLGSDEHGAWVGYPAGTFMSRPGAEFTTSNDQVSLVPRADLLTGGFVATLHGPGGDIWTYVDMTTQPVWNGATVHAVDLDLDVIRRLDDTTYVDDEDEFAEHRLAYDYPADVVALAETSCAAVLDAVLRGAAPFDEVTKQRWLAVLAGLATLAG